MPIEVDQSNKIERTEKDTILALSNDERRAILIPARVKREAIAWLKRRKKSSKMIYLRLFAAGLFILLRPRLANIIKRGQQIVIDTEYEGHESKIKGMLLRYAHAAGFQLSKEAVSFARVGKSSSAHQTAWQVQRGRLAPDHRVSLNELIELVK